MNQVWILAFGAAVAGLVQGISGFAFAMVAMAIWVWGVEPQLAAVMAVFGGWSGQLVSVIRVRRGCRRSTRAAGAQTPASASWAASWRR
jgi:uncharacterized membrane protein YfcA